MHVETGTWKMHIKSEKVGYTIASIGPVSYVPHQTMDIERKPLQELISPRTHGYRGHDFWVRFEDCLIVFGQATRKNFYSVHMLWRCGPGCGRRRKRELSKNLLELLLSTTIEGLSYLNLFGRTFPLAPERIACSRIFIGCLSDGLKERSHFRP